MINQILKSGLIVVLFTLGCKNESVKANDKDTSAQEINSKNTSLTSEDKVIRTLKNGEFKLEIETAFSNDTLDIIDYKNDYCSTPIILTQQLSFFKNDKLLHQHRLPFKEIKKKTISKTTLGVLQTPIYKVCMTKANNIDYYVVNGADCCNGSGCAEFTGIYTMKGEVIFEGVSTELNKPSLKEILLKYKIELNNYTQCIKTDDF
jgi:hypothetical protein